MILRGKRWGFSVENREPRAGLCGAGNGVGALVHVGGHDVRRRDLVFGGLVVDAVRRGW